MTDRNRSKRGNGAEQSVDDLADELIRLKRALMASSSRSRLAENVLGGLSADDSGLSLSRRNLEPASDADVLKAELGLDDTLFGGKTGKKKGGKKKPSSAYSGLPRKATPGRRLKKVAGGRAGTGDVAPTPPRSGRVAGPLAAIADAPAPPKVSPEVSAGKRAASALGNKNRLSAAAEGGLPPQTPGMAVAGRRGRRTRSVSDEPARAPNTTIPIRTTGQPRSRPPAPPSTARGQPKESRRAKLHKKMAAAYSTMSGASGPARRRREVVDDVRLASAAEEADQVAAGSEVLDARRESSGSLGGWDPAIAGFGGDAPLHVPVEETDGPGSAAEGAAYLRESKPDREDNGSPVSSASFQVREAPHRKNNQTMKGKGRRGSVSVRDGTRLPSVSLEAKGVVAAGLAEELPVKEAKPTDGAAEAIVSPEKLELSRNATTPGGALLESREHSSQDGRETMNLLLDAVVSQIVESVVETVSASICNSTAAKSISGTNITIAAQWRTSSVCSSASADLKEGPAFSDTLVALPEKISPSSEGGGREAQESAATSLSLGESCADEGAPAAVAPPASTSPSRKRPVSFGPGTAETMWGIGPDRENLGTLVASLNETVTPLAANNTSGFQDVVKRDSPAIFAHKGEEQRPGDLAEGDEPEGSGISGDVDDRQSDDGMILRADIGLKAEEQISGTEQEVELKTISSKWALEEGPNICKEDAGTKSPTGSKTPVRVDAGFTDGVTSTLSRISRSGSESSRSSAELSGSSGSRSSSPTRSYSASDADDASETWSSEHSGRSASPAPVSDSSSAVRSRMHSNKMSPSTSIVSAAASNDHSSVPYSRVSDSDSEEEDLGTELPRLSDAPAVFPLPVPALLLPGPVDGLVKAPPDVTPGSAGFPIVPRSPSKRSAAEVALKVPAVSAAEAELKNNLATPSFRSSVASRRHSVSAAISSAAPAPLPKSLVTALQAGDSGASGGLDEVGGFISNLLKQKQSQPSSSARPAAAASSDAVAGRSRRSDSVPEDGAPAKTMFSRLGFSGTVRLASRLKAWGRRTKISEGRMRRAKLTRLQQQERIRTELPRSIQVQIQEEAYPIVLRAVKRYTADLGRANPITIQSIEHLRKLARLLNIRPDF